MQPAPSAMSKFFAANAPTVLPSSAPGCSRSGIALIRPIWRPTPSAVSVSAADVQTRRRTPDVANIPLKINWMKLAR